VLNELRDNLLAARSAATTRVVPVTGFSTEFHPGDQPLTVVLLPALFVGDWQWDPIWGALTGAGWPAIRFREAVSLVERRTARSVGRLAEALLTACRQHTAGPLVVCGDSLGALIALEFGRAYPDDTVGIAVSGAPGLDRRASQFGRQLLAGSRDARQIADRFLARLLYDPERHGIDEARYASLVDELATPERIDTMLAGLHAIRSYDVPGLLPSLAMPKLFLWGRQDEITPVAPWEVAVRKLPNARLVVFDECGHAPMFEWPDEFFRELSALLSRIRSGDTPAAG
jgi:pimeloyl-ACP methyl ester carboxylesterase